MTPPFTDTLRILRTGRKLNGKQLAVKAKISGAYLSCLEHGSRSPSSEVIKRLSKALGIKPDILFISASDGSLKSTDPSVIAICEFVTKVKAIEDEMEKILDKHGIL